VGEKAAFDAAGEHDRAHRRVPIDAARQLVELTDKGRGHEVERRVREARREHATVLLKVQRLECEIADRRHAARSLRRSAVLWRRNLV
jgi:hypothetical protein